MREWGEIHWLTLHLEDLKINMRPKYTMMNESCVKANKKEKEKHEKAKICLKFFKASFIKPFLRCKMIERENKV